MEIGIMARLASPTRSQRLLLSNLATTIMTVITAMTFSASGAALGALLTVGSLSDFIGRRPAILAALALNIVAMAMFIFADSAVALIAARAVQGFATGLAAAALGAAILDIDRGRGPVLNSITAFTGLAVGNLGAGALVTYAPDPEQLVYAVLLALSGIEAIVLRFMPETVSSKPGAFASLQPHVIVPAKARRSLIEVTPVTIAS
jgi:MFS family permease